VLDGWEQFEASTVGKRIAVFSDYDGALRGAAPGVAAACREMLTRHCVRFLAAPQAR
jgi:hypothetical protein